MDHLMLMKMINSNQPPQQFYSNSISLSLMITKAYCSLKA